MLKKIFFFFLKIWKIFKNSKDDIPGRWMEGEDNVDIQNDEIFDLVGHIFGKVE